MANLRTNNLSGEQGQNAYNGSVFFDGSSSYLEIASSSDFAYGTGDFNWEAWVLLARSQATGYIFDHGNDGGTLQYESNNVRYYNSTTGNSGALYDDGGSIDYDGWHHLAVSRSSGTTKLFVNGIQKASASDSHNYSAQVLTIGDYGANSGTNKWKGYISNARICKGHAVYTSNFTPPYEQLEKHFIANDDLTTLLCCQDSDDPTQEATGKTFTAYGGVDFSHNPDNLVKNGRFTVSATAEWTHSGGSAALGTGQSGTFGDGNHLVLTGSGGYAYLRQAITTKIGRTYITDGQSNGGDASFISTSTSESDYVISDIRGGKTFVATQTTYYVILRGNNGSAGNFDTVSVYERETPTASKVIPPYGVDAGNTFDGAISMNSPSWMYFPTGRTEERVTVSNNYGARGLIMGGITYPGAGYQNVIESIQIATLGNSVDFGDLINKPNAGAGFSSKTRGFVAGGNTPDGNGVNVIQFVTIATLGNATDFGDAGYSRANARGISNNTRGVYSGGESASSPNPSLNNIEFITMSTSGNGQDFGDLVDAGSSYATASSPTRGLNLGGYRDAEVNVIDMITIATTGNSIDFGDLINTARNGNGGVSNGHRGIVMGGYSSPARTNVIQYVTIQSMGNAIDFGDLTDARDPGVTSSLTRGIATSGDYPANTNIIDFIEIMTTANAVDFGDMLTKTSSPQTCSNAHGGLADDM